MRTPVYARNPLSSLTRRLTLLEDLTSKLPTGTAFTARDTGGKVYSGHVVTHPARRLLRRGSIALVFDDPVVAITKDREGVFRARNKMRLLKLGGSLAAGKLADDAVDGAIGATKARYLAAGVGAALIKLTRQQELRIENAEPLGFGLIFNCLGGLLTVASIAGVTVVEPFMFIGFALLYTRMSARSCGLFDAISRAQQKPGVEPESHEFLPINKRRPSAQFRQSLCAATRLQHRKRKSFPLTISSR